jgi:hypothetical protein
MKKNAFAFLLFFICVAGHSQNRDSVVVKKIVDEIMTNGTAYTNLKTLCDRVGPGLYEMCNAQRAT